MNDAQLTEARRQLDICNSCRYCEGYCAVFPALERRTELDRSDLIQLANLCHDCRDCLYACMYAPPHEFAVNPPVLFASIRREQADEMSHVGVLARHERGPLSSGSFAFAVGFILVVVLAGSTVGLSGLVAHHRSAASPYDVVSYGALLAVALAAGLSALAVMVLQGRRYWRSSGPARRIRMGEVARALHHAALLTRMSGGGAGCAYPDEEETPARRLAHTAVAWGFSACLVSTVAAAIEQDGLGAAPPYRWISVPVITGLLGGIGLVLGALALAGLKRRSDPAATDAASAFREYALLVALVLLGLGGIATLALRTTPAYGIVLSLHLATVLACFVLAPFSKFTHALYRFLALVRDEQELAA